MNGEPRGPASRALITRRLAATLNAVEALCSELRTCSFAGLPPRERFVVELLLREALTNAVVHGANRDPGRAIECELEMIPGGIVLRVCDDGEGFDWRMQVNQTAQSFAESGRGLEILRRYCARLRFNEAGNGVEMVRTFDHEQPENPPKGDNYGELQN